MTQCPLPGSLRPSHDCCLVIGVHCIWVNAVQCMQVSGSALHGWIVLMDIFVTVWLFFFYYLDYVRGFELNSQEVIHKSSAEWIRCACLVYFCICLHSSTLPSVFLYVLHSDNKWLIVKQCVSAIQCSRPGWQDGYLSSLSTFEVLLHWCPALEFSFGVQHSESRIWVLHWGPAFRFNIILHIS